MREKLNGRQIPLTSSQERGTQDTAELFEETRGNLTLKDMARLEEQAKKKIVEVADRVIEARIESQGIAKKGAEKAMQEAIEAADENKEE